MTGTRRSAARPARRESSLAPTRGAGAGKALARPNAASTADHRGGAARRAAGRCRGSPPAAAGRRARQRGSARCRDYRRPDGAGQRAGRPPRPGRAGRQDGLPGACPAVGDPGARRAGSRQRPARGQRRGTAASSCCRCCSPRHTTARWTCPRCWRARAGRCPACGSDTASRWGRIRCCCARSTAAWPSAAPRAGPGSAGPALPPRPPAAPARRCRARPVTSRSCSRRPDPAAPPPTPPSPGWRPSGRRPGDGARSFPPMRPRPRPTPAEAVSALLRDGAPCVVVATYLLAPGIFADQVAASALRAGAAAVSGALGAAPEVAEIILRRYAEVIAAPGRMDANRPGDAYPRRGSCR